MSDLKFGALTSQGIEIVERVAIPDALVPPDAHVEIDAKRAAGYYSPEPSQTLRSEAPPRASLDLPSSAAEAGTRGRPLEKC